MTAAVEIRGGTGVRLHALPEYEPDGGPEPLRRWSSLRPATGPQLAVPRRTGPAMPPATLWWVLNQVLEVLDGRRPVGQVRALLPDAAYESVLTRLRTVRAKHRMRRLRTCYPTEGVVEVAAAITAVTAAQPAPARVIAMAARFEHDIDTWHCTALRVL